MSRSIGKFHLIQSLCIDLTYPTSVEWRQFGKSRFSTTQLCMWLWAWCIDRDREAESGCLYPFKYVLMLFTFVFRFSSRNDYLPINIILISLNCGNNRQCEGIELRVCVSLSFEWTKQKRVNFQRKQEWRKNIVILCGWNCWLLPKDGKKRMKTQNTIESLCARTVFFSLISQSFLFLKCRLT